VPTQFTASGSSLYVTVNNTFAAQGWAEIQIYQPQQMTVGIVLLENVQTCIIGDAYRTGEPVTVPYTSNGAAAMRFQDDSELAAVRPSDLSLFPHTQEKCLNLVMSPQEVLIVKSQVDIFIEKARSYSQGAIQLVPKYYEYQGELNMSRFSSGFWVSTSDIPKNVSSQTSGEADFVVAFLDSRDTVQNISYPFNYGGLAVIAYSMIPLSWWSGDSGAWTYPLHEWIHQVDFALGYVTEVQDVYAQYDSHYPQSLCGRATTNPWSWFPSPDSADTAPDFLACAYYYENWTAYCNAHPAANGIDCGQEWNMHILGLHYPRGILLRSNSARQ